MTLNSSVNKQQLDPQKNQSTNQPLEVEYYTDVLCIWAWVAQRRVYELDRQFASKIQLRCFYLDVFGDSVSKIEMDWGERGGYKAYAEHVRESAAAYCELPVNTKTWSEVRPVTSASAHVLIKAVEREHGAATASKAALAIRNAFFIDARDISCMPVLREVIQSLNLDWQALDDHLQSGAALAALMADYKQCRSKNIQGSPSYVMDRGHQTLYGNVGFRVIQANIEELLRHPAGEASWC